MIRDKMKLANFQPGYWGRKFQTNVKDEPQAGQMLHALAFGETAVPSATKGIKAHHKWARKGRGCRP